MANPLSKFIDPNSIEPLPTFSTYDATSNYAGSVYDSNLSAVTNWIVNTSAEGWSYSHAAGNGSTAPSSNGSTSNGAAHTPANQAEGNMHMNPPSIGGYGAMMRHTTNTASVWARFGTVIGFPGTRQKISLYASGNSLGVYPRGSLVPMETLTTNTATFRNIIGEPGTTCNGMISYNDRTKTIAYVTNNGSSTVNYRVHVWRHPGVNLNTMEYKVGDLYKFLTEAKSGVNGASYYYNDFTWSTTSATSYTESMSHMRIIMGDNGTLGIVRFTPDYGTYHAYAVLNPSGTAITGSVTQISTNACTTSYGIEQGSQYGMRSNITWDNQWIAAYAPYYYYGSGICMHLVYTQDPSKGYKYTLTDSSFGINVAPIRENAFILHRTSNADSAGMFSYMLMNPGGTYVNGLNDVGTAVANGGALTTTSESGYLDVTHTSTNYTSLIAMSSWTGGGR